MKSKSTAGDQVRTRIHIATGLACLLISVYATSVVLAEMQSIERGAEIEARGVARSLEYGAAFSSNLQTYVQTLSELHDRDIVFVDAQKMGLADANPAEIGMLYNNDPGNEVGLTIVDGKTRTFVEQNSRHPEGLKQVVIPTFPRGTTGGSPVGAVILDYGGIYTQLFDAAVRTLWFLSVAGLWCVITTGILGFKLGNAVRESAKKMNFLAFHDGLTGLANRSLFSASLSESLNSSIKSSKSLAIFFIDLDRFKNINDTLGHAAGDALLKEAAKRIESCFDENALVARNGGDEFVVMVSGVQDSQLLKYLAKKMLTSLALPVSTHGQQFRVTASIGISVCPADGEDEQSLMKNADIAMYRAKQDGKNGFAFYAAEMNQHSVEQLAFESSFRQAVDQEKFHVHYQPKINSLDGRIVGVEALLRWDDPDLGSVPPVKFIALAEETGLMVPLGKWVLRTACKQQVAWVAQGLEPMNMAVNLSPRQFLDKDLLDDVRSILMATEMCPSQLELEITESMMIEDAGHALKMLEALRSLGIQLSVDDFGTGYSSLSNLKRFPVNTIKVDRSFVRELPNNLEDRAITEAIIAMCRSLSLNVVAEGVETQEQATFLRDHGCNELQGFYFSKAISSADISVLLERQRSAMALEPNYG